MLDGVVPWTVPSEVKLLLATVSDIRWADEVIRLLEEAMGDRAYDSEAEIKNDEYNTAIEMIKVIAEIGDSFTSRPNKIRMVIQNMKSFKEEFRKICDKHIPRWDE